MASTTPNLSRLPPLGSLRAFVVAARHLSFARAAEELHVTAAAISQQIKQLEEFLGRPLFHRQGRSLQLTADGRACLPRLTEAFEGISEALAALPARDKGGALTVSVAPSFASKWLVPRLEKFKAAHPRIDVRISATNELVDFGTADVDCAIRYGAGNYAPLAVSRLMPEAVFPVCSPALADGTIRLDSPAALQHFTLLHDDSPDRDDSCPDWRMWLLAAGVTGVDPHAGPRFNQSSLVLDAAMAGQGVALAKARLAHNDLKSGRLVRPFGATEQRIAFAYYFICPPNKLALPRVKAFKEWLHEEAASEEAASDAELDAAV